MNGQAWPPLGQWGDSAEAIGLLAAACVHGMGGWVYVRVCAIRGGERERRRCAAVHCLARFLRPLSPAHQAATEKEGGGSVKGRGWHDCLSATECVLEYVEQAFV